MTENKSGILQLNKDSSSNKSKECTTTSQKKTNTCTRAYYDSQKDSREKIFDENVHKFISEPNSKNEFYPNLTEFEKVFFGNEKEMVHLRNLSESLAFQSDYIDGSEFMCVTTTDPTDEMREVNILENINEAEENSRLRTLCLDKITPSNDNLCERSTRSTKDLIADIETFVTKLLQDLVSFGTSTIPIVSSTNWKNVTVSNDVLSLKEPSMCDHVHINLKQQRSKYHFALIMYILSKIYHLLITGTLCTERELFYDDPDFVENQINVKLAIKDICSLLNCSPWDLGIRLSSKGLIGGAITIHMTDNNVIDCKSHNSIAIIPNDMQSIATLETSAKYILIVEKETVFEKLVRQDIFFNFDNDLIVITGKGYPDINTRLMIKRLWNDFKLPIYALVDADPFGIEIMLVYRFGSRGMALSADDLACPHIRWIGILPSEIELLAVPSMDQEKQDKKKIVELLHRSYVKNEIRNEIEILQRLGRKAEIEGISSFSVNFLVSDYIPNKITRKLYY